MQSPRLRMRSVEKKQPQQASLLPPSTRYVFALCCAVIIGYTAWMAHSDQLGLSAARRPLSASLLTTNLHAAASSFDSAPRDEDTFDEEHQQGVVHMYGAPAVPSGSSGPVSPTEPGEQENPYNFPGMTPNESPYEWDYGITIDCGSKGSRLHIYKWQHRHSPSSIPPFTPLFTKHAWTERVAPGISAFVDQPDLVIPQLVFLLEFARNSLSEFRHKWNRIPIYVKATAGMRLVKNLPSRDRIMEQVRAFLSDKTTNPFFFERTMARVISGEEEGVYGWMTANYLSGTLMHASSATSYGALDMGGASVQITFRPPFDVLSNYFPLRIQQERIRLYSHSFLNFGIDLALQRVNDRLIEIGNHTRQAGGPDLDAENAGAIPQVSGHSYFLGVRDGVRVFRHPCFPRGFSFTYLYVVNTDLRASYGGQRMGDDESGVDMSPITTYSEANAQREMVQFEGSQDFTNCSAITWQLLHKRSACFDNTCSFDGQYQPRFGNVTFLAFSEFSKVVVGDLGLSRNATLKEIDARTREVCQKYSWQELQDMHRYAKIDDLSKLCFNARYIFTVLYKGFGFPYEGKGNLVFVNNILGLDLSWAMGSTLYEANAMPWDIDGKHGVETFRYQMGSNNNGGGGSGAAGGSAASGSGLTKEEQEAQTAGGKKPSRRERKVMKDDGRRQETEYEREQQQQIRDEAMAEAREEQAELLPRQPPVPPPSSAAPVVPVSSQGKMADAPASAPVAGATPSDASCAGSGSSSAGSAPKVTPWSFPYIWGLFGFLIGGWLITLILFVLYWRHSRRELRRMEESGLRYEPIHNAEA